MCVTFSMLKEFSNIKYNCDELQMGECLENLPFFFQFHSSGAEITHFTFKVSFLLIHCKDRTSHTLQKGTSCLTNGHPNKEVT